MNFPNENNCKPDFIFFTPDHLKWPLASFLYLFILLKNIRFASILKDFNKKELH